MNTENDQAFDDDYMLQLALQMSIQQVRFHPAEHPFVQPVWL